MIRRMLAVAMIGFAGALLARPAYAQEEKCHILCSPVFLWQGGLIHANVFDPPDVVDLSTGEVMEVEGDTELLARFTLVIPTELRRFSLVALFQWTPWADRAANPFTGRTAAELGEEDIDANELALVYGGIIDLITPEMTKGWFNSSLNILAVYSPAAELEDKGTYTHKFLPELYVNLGIFNWLPKGNWLRNVSLYGILDFVATGLPDEGDVIGGVRFLDDADPWVILTGIQFQIAPFSW